MASENEDRQRRLREALRANLRRRKGQARERDNDADGPESAKDESSSDIDSPAS